MAAHSIDKPCLLLRTMGMGKKELDHPFYRPLWRRIAIVAVCLFWVAFEVATGPDTMWLMLALAFTGYSLWTFIIAWPRKTDPE